MQEDFIVLLLTSGEGEMTKRSITFSVDVDNDKDIITWVDSQDNKSGAIRKAIRTFLGHDLSLSDVYQEIAEVKRLLKSGAVVAVQEGNNDQEIDDPQVVQVKGILDGLGL
jgi:hypothetical protein